jgi:hypothetical protein
MPQGIAAFMNKAGIFSPGGVFLFDMLWETVGILLFIIYIDSTINHYLASVGRVRAPK